LWVWSLATPQQEQTFLWHRRCQKKLNNKAYGANKAEKLISVAYGHKYNKQEQNK
jgi:hypothetical protein